MSQSPFKNLLRVVVPDGGVGMGTKVFTADGKEVGGVERIAFHPIDADSLVVAEITLIVNLGSAPPIE